MKMAKYKRKFFAKDRDEPCRRGSESPAMALAPSQLFVRSKYRRLKKTERHAGYMQKKNM
jgi:hypothetical protein